METVGAYEAKTHLPRLLERVARGERIVITRHGVPVAVLQPVDPDSQQTPAEVIEKIKAFRSGQSLGNMELRDLIEEGRS